MEEKRPKMTKLGFYNFFRSPDGEDCLEKVFFATKYGTLLGLTISAADIGMVSFSRTIRLGIGRILCHTPAFDQGNLYIERPTYIKELSFAVESGIAGMGAAYATTVCLAGQIRQKSNFVNHALGGAAIGAVFGAKYGCPIRGGQVALFFGVILGLIKYLKENNLPLDQRVPRKYGRYNPRFDWAIKIYDDPGRPMDP